MEEIVEMEQEGKLEMRAVKTPVTFSEQITPTPVPTITPSPSIAPTPTKAPSTPSPSPTPSYDLTKVKNEKGYVKGHDVNLRKGPGTDYKVIDSVRYHTELVITGKTEEWYRVKIGDTTGFMLKEFVGVGSIPTPTPTPKATEKPKATKAPAKTAAPTPRPAVEQGEKGNYSDDDIYLVAKLIYAEGKNQTTESFQAMANVLYNRCHSKSFGGSVEEEVYRKNQFTVVDNSDFATMKPSSAAIKAAKTVFNEGTRVLPTKVMFFRSSRLGTKWSKRTFYATIGGNNYFS
ncbi:cell wall hydrolase [Christensenellaceae bacterium OttesenSCG-928-M15]|nr:cell wall hydrolase [Christensenellaceae bacterium OttesenSCG-928-M15]